MAEKDDKLIEIEKLSGEELEKGEKIEQYLTRIHKSYKGINDELSKKAKELKKELDTSKSLSDADKQRTDQLKKEVELLRQKNKELSDGQEETLKSMKEQFDNAKKNGTASKDELNTLEENIKKQEKKVKKSKEFGKEVEESTKKSRSLGEVFSSIGKTISSMGSGLLNIGNSLTGGFFSGLFDPILHPLQFISQTIQELMGREREFASVTGKTARSMGVDVSYLSSRWGQFGVDAATANKTYLEMYSSMASFTKIGTAERDRLTGHTSAMKNFGISAEAVSRNYDLLMKGMKMSSQQVTNFSDRLMKHAIAAGITPKKMVEEFAAAAPKLAVYGKHAEDVYIRIQKAAKGLGMEMQSLMGIVGDTFDTFEGSAMAAGRLNAILGGNFLNSVEMLNASEDERILIIKRAMEASGKQFDQLGKFEQKAIAGALNITDMAEANKLFGTSTGELNSDMKKQASTQEQLVQGLKAAADPMKQLSSMFDALRKELMPLLPYIQKFMLYLSSPEVKSMLENFIETVKGKLRELWEAIQRNETFKEFKKGILGVWETIKSLNWENIKEKMNEAWTWIKVKIEEYVPTIIEWIGKIGIALFVVSKIMDLATPGFGKLGFVIIGVAAAIGFVIYQLVKFAEVFKSMNEQQSDKFLTTIKWAIAGIVIGVIAITAAAKAAGPEVLLFGAGVGLMGVGIGAAALGLSKLVEAFGYLAEKISGGFRLVLDGVAHVFHEIGDAGDKVAKGLVTLLNTVSFSNVALMAKLATEMNNIADSGEDFVKAMAGFNGFTGAINGLPDAKVSNFSGALNNLNTLISNPNLIASSKSLVEAITTISSALNSMPDNKKILLDSVINTVNSVKTVDEASIKPSKDFFEAVAKYYQAQSTAKAASEDAVVQALKEMSSAVIGELRQGREEGRNINVTVNNEGGGSSNYGQQKGWQKMFGY